jgi:hypothetical protein
MSKGWKADRFGPVQHNDQAAAIAPLVRLSKRDKFATYTPPAPAPAAGGNPILTRTKRGKAKRS